MSERCLIPDIAAGKIMIAAFGSRSYALYVRYDGGTKCLGRIPTCKC